MQVEALKATTETKEVTFKIAYGLPLSEMRRWGLYISYPRNLRETDQPFPEPALFLLNPDGEVHIVDYSNSPFARPDLRILIEGMHLSPPSTAHCSHRHECAVGHRSWHG